jgi:cell division protein FtsB
MKDIKKPLLIASIVISMTILGFTAFGKRGFVSLLTLKQRKERIATETENLRNENDNLKSELIRLQKKEYRDRTIRSKMGMVKEGEVIYIFTPE